MLQWYDRTVKTRAFTRVEAALFMEEKREIRPRPVANET